MNPTLRSVIRLDSLPLNQTYYTPEGYLVDRPILTSTGIFEYLNPDGSIRRELRLPEDVFDPESLKSYKGRPIIITHDAGLVTTDNVKENAIGTILTEGYRSGDDVRAEIIIHDTVGMKKAGLKELSLGYNLDLEETPGEWNGQHYDAIQRNIRINHLALVGEARAGEQARLNIDGRDPNLLKGVKAMKKTKKTSRGDGVLSPEDLAKAIEEYKARRAARLAEKADNEEVTAEETATEVATDNAEVAEATAEEETATATDSAEETTEEPTTEEQVQLVKDRRDRRDEAGDPETVEEAQGVIAQQDEDMNILFDIIDSLLAQADFTKADEDTAETATEETATEEAAATDGEEGTEGEEETVIGASVAEDSEDVEETTTETASTEGKLNADSVDAIVRTRIQLGMVGRKLNLDGLEMMRIMDAKKAIIHAVRPNLRLDGKSVSYINAAYDMAVSDVNAKSEKDTGYQKRQMFNGDGKRNDAKDENSANAARERMIARRNNKQ